MIWNFSKRNIIFRPVDQGIETVDVLRGAYDCSPALTSSCTSAGGGYANIACAIDPTYQRRVMQGELSMTPSYQSAMNTNSSSNSSSSSGMATSSGTGLPSSVSSPLSPPLPPPGKFNIFILGFF